MNTTLFFLSLALGVAAFVVVVFIIVGTRRVDREQRADDPPANRREYDTLI